MGGGREARGWWGLGVGGGGGGPAGGGVGGCISCMASPDSESPLLGMFCQRLNPFSDLQSSLDFPIKKNNGIRNWRNIAHITIPVTNFFAFNNLPTFDIIRVFLSPSYEPNSMLKIC